MLKLTFKTKTKTLSLKTKTKSRTLKFNTQTKSKTLKISSLDSQDRQQVDLWLTTHTVAYQLQQGCLQWTELKLLVMRATLCHQTNAERKWNVLITVHFNTRFVCVQITKYKEMNVCIVTEGDAWRPTCLPLTCTKCSLTTLSALSSESNVKNPNPRTQ